MLVKITEQGLMRAGTNKLSFDIGRAVMAAAMYQPPVVDGDLLEA